MSHTKEPWSIDEYWQVFAESIGEYVAVTEVEDDGRIPPEIVAANARRIVACVNACAGIKTQDLEAMRGTSILEKANSSFDSVHKQRDELLSVLEDLLRQGDFFLTAIEAKDGWSSDFEEIERRAMKAISKAKGE